MAALCGKTTQRNILHNTSLHSKRSNLERKLRAKQSAGIPGDAMSHQETRDGKEIMDFQLIRAEHECKCEEGHEGVQTEAQL
jgi:hypothetical protein